MTSLIPYQIPVFEYLAGCTVDQILGLGRFIWLLETEYNLNTVIYTFKDPSEENESGELEDEIFLGIALDAGDKDKENYPDPFFSTLKNVAYACNCPPVTITWYKDEEPEKPSEEVTQ
jgi:hypothetical protein